MPLSGGQELSLRHLPDVSDASFSFQIPVPAREDYLLAEDGDDDFFKGVNDVLATPVAPSRPTQHEPLTLSQLTPRPSETSHHQIHYRSPLPSLPSPARDLSNKSRPKEDTSHLPYVRTRVAQAQPKAIKKPALHLLPNEGSPAGARLDTLRAEVDLLAKDLVEGTSTSKPAPPIQSRLRSPKGFKRQSIDKGEPQSLGKRRREKADAPVKRTVISGAIAKARKHKPSSSVLPSSVKTLPQHAIASAAPSESSIQLTGNPQSNGDLDDANADTSVGSIALGGVAERLLMYSQKFISCFGLVHSDLSSEPQLDPEQQVPGQVPIPSTAIVVGHEFSEDHNKPLTISQLSPQKPVLPLHALSPNASPSASPPISPLRPSSKRPASTQADLDQSRKKVRSVPSRAGTSSHCTVNNDALAPLRTRPPHKELHQAEASGSRPKSKGARVREETKTRPIRVKQQRQPPVFKPRDRREAKARSNPKSSTTAAPTDLQKPHQGTTAVGGSFEVQGMSSAGLSLQSEEGQIRSTSLSGEHVASRPAIATRPMAFTFHSDARLEARSNKLENDESKKLSSSSQRVDNDKKHRLGVSIPDFKIMHAAQEAEFALRKENICPTVPLPMRFETDFRVKERQKFDERMREKEREMERAMEQRRREREEQEEKEVRELRKRAVPRAHEVPEWYKEAPKKRERAS